MILPLFRGDAENTENFEQWRQRLLDETSRFIEWGLAHPEQVQWIPSVPVGRGRFSQAARRMFWSILTVDEYGPEE